MSHYAYASLSAESSNPDRNARLVHRLKRLGMAGAVLHIGAHPDDEDIGLLAYLSRKLGVRTVYWSATRGEGGQNRIGPYVEESLGIFRTWESLNARAIDGCECLFGPFYDFGYSNTAEKPLAKWGRENIVREIVRAIRLVQPHVIISKWKGTPGDFHGHHQAVGQAMFEAFEAAGDPNRFPELASQGLVPWQPLKFYHSTNNSGGDLTAGGAVNASGLLNAAFEKDGFLRVNTGEFDPVAGMTYQQRAWMAYNQHKTQSMGLAPAPGDFYYYFSLHKSLVPVPPRESGLFDGMDPSLSGLAHYPGNGSSSLKGALERIAQKAAEALCSYRVEDPQKAVLSLLEGLDCLRELCSDLKREEMDGTAREALDRYLSRKLVNFEATVARCAGLELECITERPRIVPGDKCRVSARLWSHLGSEVEKADFDVRLPQGWQSKVFEEGDSRPRAGQPSCRLSPVCANLDMEIAVAEAADLSCPYWLARPRTSYLYSWPEGEPCSHPFGPPAAEVRCDVSLCGRRVTLRKEIASRQSFPGGFRELPLAVIPPITLRPKSERKFLPVTEEKQTLELHVAVQNNSDCALQGHLELDVPDGWKVFPDRIDLSLSKPGEIETVLHKVIVPAGIKEGCYTLRYRTDCGQRNYAVTVDPVRMALPGLPAAADASNCIREEFILKPARVVIHVIDVGFIQGQRYGYVKGAAEGVVEALKPFGIDFHLISDEDMGYLDLSRFHAVVIGPNAYPIRDELRKCASRFLDYVKEGGTLIVQYQGYGYEAPGLAPYPFRYNQPHDRITYEDAPVTLLDPTHAFFRLPNAITPKDFEGWVRDRGMYFFGHWDKRYSTILSSEDPGQKPLEGGLVECQFGRGNFIYAAYSFFRQLPAGVPGAFRLFANILALPEARILERIEFIRKLSLFSTMSDAYLDAVARLIFERWEEDDTYLCRQGDEGDELYIVYRGEIEIVRETEGKRHVFVAKKGDCIGELAVLGNASRTASLRTLGEVQLLVIKGPVFLSLLNQFPDMAIRIIRFLVDRYTPH